MRRFLIVLAFLFAGNTYTNGHPIHVSVCNLELKGNESILSVKLYKDDFGTVIQNAFNDTLILENADEDPYREYILHYVTKNLKLYFDNKKPMNLVYDYSEFNEESIWLYFKVKKIKISEKLRIINTLMLDLFEDQTNLLIINLEGKQNGFRFNNFIRELDIEM